MRRSCLLLLLALLVAGPARAETLSVPFTSSGGVWTSGSYGGDVEITVSGTGWSLGACLNDAFYVFSGCGSPYYDSSWYHLRINGAHPATQIGVPSYDSGHVYTFMYTLPTSPAQVRFWVSDGNFNDNGGSYSITIGPANDPPVAEAGGPYATAEGNVAILDGSGSTDDGTIVDYAWDCDDDGVFEQAGASPLVTCAYDDDGTFTARLVVTDDEGETGEDTSSVDVANLDPAMSGHSLPSDLNEGQIVVFSAAATDPGPLDVLTFTWSWGDGSPDTVGDVVSQTYGDDGAFTVTLTVDDGDGGQVVSSWPMPVNNVPPIFVSTAPTTATEGLLYSYPAVTTDPAGVNDPPAFSLSVGPAGMSTTPDGLVQWTPTLAQALAGSTSVILRVNDGDGGLATQAWTVTVAWVDDDGDGMSDTWETDNALDPTDPSDAGEDPDGDGLTNLDEFLAGTDPNAFGGPGAPVPVAPIAGVEAGNTSPDLVVDNAVDPDGNALDLFFEVYDDAALTSLVVDSPAVPQDPVGESLWKVDVVLAENTTFHWRARASDAWAPGPWSVVESFVVNQNNEPPTAPTPATPLEGEAVASVTPLTQWGPSSDPDGDAITYAVEVYADAEEPLLVAQVDGLALAASGFVEWTVDVVLAEDAWHLARARATDEHGLSGDWSAEVGFLVTADEGAPAGVVILAPDDGGEVDTPSPLLVAGGAVDPEGQPLVYAIEVGTDAGFSEVDATEVPEVDGEGAWDLAEAGIELPEDSWAFVRARAGDGLLWSPWASATFFVNEANGAPTVPVLVAPIDGVEVLDRPFELVAAWSSDVDEDGLRYRFVVASDAALEQRVVDVPDQEGGNALLDGPGEVSWAVGSVLEPGDWFWSAQATDEHGLESGWAEPATFVIPQADVGDDDDAGDDDDDPDLPDCGCSAGAAEG